jgi:hypothetical protein
MDFFADPVHPTLAELDAYEARALGAEDPEAPFLTGRDTWYPNPYYTGEPIHPEVWIITF